MSFRVVNERTRQKLQAASAEGHRKRWGPSAEARAAKRAAIVADFAITGSKCETARRLGVSSGYVCEIINGHKPQLVRPLDDDRGSGN